MSDDLSFRINTTYAVKYEERKRKEELSRLKDKYGEHPEESESSSSESEDEEAKGVTTQNDCDFLRTLSLIKADDARIRDSSYKFYNSESETQEDTDVTEMSTKKKPMFLKDYERKRLMEKGSLALVSSDEEEGDDQLYSKKKAHLMYDKEQRDLRKSLKQSIAHEDSEEEDDNEPLLQLRKKTDEEQQKEDEDYVRWLEGKEGSKLKRKMAEDMNALQRYWTDPNLSENERFLRDYILHKGYIDRVAQRIPTYDELVATNLDDEDEEEVEKQEEFERKYNFRFEEPGGAKMISHPRNITGSVRQQDETRKAKRKERKSCKEKEKEEKREELKRLKNLKRKEIAEKLEKLKEVTGNATIGFDAGAIEGDFDPDVYDHMMKSAFSEDFYSRDDEDDEKPVFSDEEWENAEEVCDENWDEWQGNDEGPHVDDPEFNMDADFDPSVAATTSQAAGRDVTGLKRNRKMSKFAEVLRRKKPTFNPDEKNFEKYFDEYYQMDYEDVVAGQPCRFKYRKVTPNDFGLSVAEMLTCEKGELNRWASLKRVVQYRTEEEEARDVKKFKRKGENSRKKLQLLPSLQQSDRPADEDNDISDSQETRSSKTKRDKQAKHKRKKQKRSAREDSHQEGVATKVSFSRLKSYGLKATKRWT